jgi:hypothetical protein
MKVVIPAITVVFVASGVLSAPAVAAAAKKPQMSATQSFNACVELAKQRGFSPQDLDTGGERLGAARAFVLRCMQGKQR